MEYKSSVKWICLVLVAGFLMAGCAGTPDVNPMVQEVQVAYSQAEEDTMVVNNAPMALQKAEEALRQVEQLSRSGADSASIERQAYLALQQVKIAEKRAEIRAAQEQIKRASTELEILMENLSEADKKTMGAGPSKVEAKERAQQLRHFQAIETNRGLVIRFLDLRFAQEQASLTSSVEQPINELADFLSDYPERTVLIEGHTDNTGAASFNKSLSQKRADVVRDALISRGVNPDRIQSVGLGEEYPIASNDTEVGRRENRRVEVVISDESGNIPERES